MTTRGARYWNSGSIPLIGPDILGDIIATLADLAIVISSEGRILSVLANPAHKGYADLDRWERSDLRDHLTSESVPKFERALATYLRDPAAVRPVELNHRHAADRWEFPINYTLHRIGPDDAILMLGRDLRPIAEMQQQLVRAQMALEKDYERQREHDVRFQVLFGHVADAMLFVSARSGKIEEANEAAATLLGRSREALAGRDLMAEFDAEGGATTIAELVATAREAKGRAAPAVALSTARTGRAVRVRPVLFRAAGEQVLLCRLEAADAGEAAAPDPRERDLSGLFDLGADGIVTTDGAGAIRLANEAFLNLIDGTDHRSVVGRPLGDFLARGGVDLQVMLDGAAKSGRVRHYATRLVGEYGGERAVTVAATHLAGQGRDGFAFVLRDAGGAATAEPPEATALAAARPVAELVGGAPMKDIVAQTADVVERMCIETAIELTGNNRVAAAVMLGVSRQSLYVKLRKYGLVDRTAEPPSDTGDD